MIEPLTVTKWDDGGCSFLIRGEDETPEALRRCNRRREEHPVTGLGRFANHRNFLPRDAFRSWK